VPKIFKLHKKGALDTALFEGATINTPSMLVIEDAIDTLTWAEGLGGAKGLIGRVNESFDHFRTWLASTPHFASLASNPATMSQTALCLVITDDWFGAQEESVQKALVKDMLARLEDEGVAVDINAYRDAPTGLRIWGGPTVDPVDIERLLPWVDWAYEVARAHHRQAAA
jgi:phosphoserine aminotransferase